MQFTQLDKMETVVVETQRNTLLLADYAPGVHCTPQAFFKKEADGSVPWVVTRVCDHAGGVLQPSQHDATKAYCPLHNWEFDFDSLSYSKIPNQPFEHLVKKPLPFSVENGVLSYETDRCILRVPASLAPDTSKRTYATLRHLTHASVMLEVDGIKMLTDPWFVGECLAGGWWLKHPPKADVWKLLDEVDFLYISHNHPDHLHPETLARARRDIPIIVPKFPTHSVATPLRAMGFTNVHELKLKRLYRVNDTDLLISILPTGDHRDDSGLFVTKGDFSTVMTVDCVGTNQYVLPENITMLLTNFSSGASGWPLCYEVVGSLDDRAKVVTKNRGTAMVEVMKYIAATKPKAYMPYAGFFEELALRDAEIRQYNVKNPPNVVVDKVRAKYPDIVAVNPCEHDVMTWENGAISTSNVNQPPLFTYDAATIAHYLSAQRDLLKYFDLEKVAEYFSQSEFKDVLIVYLVLTDDHYEPQGKSLRLDFSTQPISHTVVDSAALLAEFNEVEHLDGKRHLLIKARTDSLWQIVYFGRPLEELTLGFQCRINRKPDQYNASFWKHYTTYGAPMLRTGEDHLLYKLMEGA